MNLDLQGKVALVTGGSGGIGKIIAMELAKEGANVAVSARSYEPLAEVSKQISEETHQKVIAVTADSTKADEVDKAVQEVVNSLGSVDILVNSGAPAGGLATGPFESIAEDLILEDFNIKYLGYFRYARSVAAIMKQKKWGRIINLGGLAARNSGPFSAGARNIAIAHMSKTLSDELGPFGITVNLVHPGMVRTDNTAANFEARAKREGVTVEALEAQLSQNNAIRHIVTAQEIAHIVAFLASPKSVAITGEVIATGGGTGSSVYA
jgi:NAD(P)-dependent dehydrogenase (short-subunit alcohol dehydrogenase family)